MDFEVSFFTSARTKKVSNSLSLIWWLKQTISKEHNDWTKKVLKYRTFQSKRTKSTLPCITISASFKKVRNLKKIKKKNPLLCLDIDRDLNPCIDLKLAKEFFTQHPSVLYCGRSVSGNGLYIILYLSKKNKLNKYFKHIRKQLRSKGIIIDDKCKDYTRLRFFSIDETAYLNEEPLPLKLPKKKKVIKGEGPKVSISIEQRVETIVQFIESNNIDITSDYNDWIKVAGALQQTFGEQGRSYFHRVSKFYPDYKYKRADKKYDQCKNMKSLKINSFFHVADKHGVRY